MRDGDTTPTVYAVDDDPIILAHLKAALAAGGYRVTEFLEPRAALRAAVAEPPSLLILDVRMPVIDGVELLGRLRASEAFGDTPVIMLTGGMRLDRIVLAMSAGANGYLMKPFTAEQILAKVDEHLWDAARGRA